MHFHCNQDMIHPGLHLEPGIYAGPGFCPKFYGTGNPQRRQCSVSDIWASKTLPTCSDLVGNKNLPKNDQ